MTDQEIIDRLMNALHDIGGAYTARRALERNLTEPLRKSMTEKALTDEQIEKLALDTWEAVALALHDGR